MFCGQSAICPFEQSSNQQDPFAVASDEISNDRSIDSTASSGIGGGISADIAAMQDIPPRRPDPLVFVLVFVFNVDVVVSRHGHAFLRSFFHRSERISIPGKKISLRISGNPGPLRTVVQAAILRNPAANA